MGRHPLEIVIDTGPEHPMQALQGKTSAIPASYLERKINQTVGDTRHVHHLEVIGFEYGVCIATPGLITCEYHLVIIPCIDCDATYGPAGCAENSPSLSIPR